MNIKHFYSVQLRNFEKKYYINGATIITIGPIFEEACNIFKNILIYYKIWLASNIMQNFEYYINIVSFFLYIRNKYNYFQGVNNTLKLSAVYYSAFMNVYL